MEDLINIVLDNPFFIIIIIGAIFSLLKGKPKQAEQEAQQEQRAKQAEQAQQKQRAQQAQQEREQKRDQRALRTLEVPKTTSTIQSNNNRPTDRQRQEAISNLSTDQNSGMVNRIKVADARRDREIQNMSSSYSQVKFKKDFKKALSSEGLINSVIMAEVLGLPRAKNPYQSVTTKRVNN